MTNIRDFFKDRVMTAPMAGITDAPFRKLVRRFGGELLFSEMLSTESLAHGHDRTQKMAFVSDAEIPVAVQLAGHRPETMEAAVKMLADAGDVAFVNINMGCPIRKITSAGNGCALMKDVDSAARLVDAAANASPLPVTVKCRLGWSQDDENYLSFLQKMIEAGAQAVILHARTQEQGYSGTADWNAVKNLKKAVRVPVIGNGDIRTCYDAAARLAETGADAVMVGRGTLGRPWLTHDCAAYVRDGKAPFVPTTTQLRDIVLLHLDLLEEYFGAKNAVFVARKHIAWYASGRTGNAIFRETVNQTAAIDDLRALIRRFFEENGQ